MEAVISLSGNVGTDIEYHGGEEWSFARFRLATTPRVRKAGEWTDAETIWLNVRTQNRLADNVRQSIAKGDPVIVVGQIRNSVWVNQGERHERLVLEASWVGHDLNRGTSTFVRNEKKSSESSGEQAWGQAPDTEGEPSTSAVPAEPESPTELEPATDQAQLQPENELDTALVASS